MTALAGSRRLSCCCHRGSIVISTTSPALPAEFNGQRLPIREFNDANAARKISPLLGLRHYVPESQRDALGVEKDVHGSHSGSSAVR
jgi:hypothetical protein